MTNQNIPKVQAVMAEPTWLERIAQWLGITSHSAFIGWTAKMLGVYVVCTMVYEKRLEQALTGIVIILLGELIMVTAQRLDALCSKHNNDMLSVLDTLKQSVMALQPQKTTTTTTLSAKLIFDGRDLVSAASDEPVVVSVTETTTPQKQDNSVATSQ